MNRLVVLTIALPLLVACTADGPDQPPARVPAAEMTSIERGQKLWSRCRACHTLGEGERNKVGPNLWGIFGRTAGAREDFNYSRAMKAADLIWNDKTMSAYLADPKGYIPGNRMTYVGLRQAEDRAAIIEYLRAETGG